MEVINANYIRNHEHLPMFPPKEGIIKMFGKMIPMNSVFLKKHLHRNRQIWLNGHAGGCEWNPDGTAMCPGGSKV